MFLLFQIRELVPESQAYMDLLAFERKLDQTIMRKRVDIQEALKRPMKVPWLGGRKRGLSPIPRMEKRARPGGWLCTTLFISTAKAEAASLYLQHF